MELPMPIPSTPGPRTLASYKVLSFDVYGSLIEYKAHILKSFKPLIERIPDASSPYLNPAKLAADVPDSATVGEVEFLRLFQKQEDAIKLEKPVKRFDEIMAEIFRRIARDLHVDMSESEARLFGSETTISQWPSFAGTAAALETLSKHYRLIALSNIDPFAWQITASSSFSGLRGVDWWKVFTSQDYGDDAHRADEAKLETAIKFCAADGISKDEILHVAQSLGHDHAPAKGLGLDSVWLVGDGPKWGKQEESRMVLEKKLVGYRWKARNLKEFADVVEDAFSKG